jgi:predicted AlkP superfamily phosphohydrolase/phosphomutase
MLAKGELPNIKSLIDNGAKGKLLSIQPPVSPPAWRTAITGVNPGKHGIYEFPGRQEERYGLIFKKSFDKRAKPCWVYLTEKNLTSLYVNIPTMYPPEPIKGHMITGLFTPDANGEFTYPPELKEKYCDYEIDVTCEFNLDTLDKYVGDLRKLAEIRRKTILSELKETDWDFAWVAFTGCDRVQHRYRGFNYSGSILFYHQERNKYINTIRDFWIFLDNALGDILKITPPDTLVMLMSDHGHAYSDSMFFMYGWLKSLGLMYAEMKPMEFPWYKKIFLSDETIEFTKQVHLDWSRTKAYASGYMGQIYINLKGREPYGIVEPGKEYEEVRDRIIDAAKYLLDPRTGKPAVKAIHRREDIYEGEYFEDAPDLIIEWNHPYSIIDKIPTQNGTDGKTYIINDIFGTEPALCTGIHRLEGIIVLNGPGILKGEEIKESSLYDLLPTAYCYLGVPIPYYMEGKVLSVFAEGTVNIPQYIEDNLYIDEPESMELSEEERAALAKQMKALGYMK